MGLRRFRCARLHPAQHVVARAFRFAIAAAAPTSPPDGIANTACGYLRDRTARRPRLQAQCGPHPTSSSASAPLAPNAPGEPSGPHRAHTAADALPPAYPPRIPSRFPCPVSTPVLERSPAACAASTRARSTQSKNVNRLRGTSSEHQRHNPRPFGPRGTAFRSTHPPRITRTMLIYFL